MLPHWQLFFHAGKQKKRPEINRRKGEGLRQLPEKEQQIGRDDGKQQIRYEGIEAFAQNNGKEQRKENAYEPSVGNG